jgi:hypothetical protein
MGVPVRTVAAGGIPVVDVTATTPKLGMPVTEATYGVAVTKVTLPKGGIPVTYVAATLQVLEGGSEESRTGRGGAGEVAREKDPAKLRSV